MTARIPTIREISWVAVIPQLMVLFAMIAVALALRPADGVLWGAGLYLIYSFSSRRLLTRSHRSGMALVRQERFDEAIPWFRKSLEFFDRYPLIDRFRSVVMLSASAMSYREMALANIAFCYSQIGQGENARRHYEQCLERFPDSGVARAALRMMDASGDRE